MISSIVGKLVLAYAGTGKSYLANKYENVIDLDSGDFKWIGKRKDIPYYDRPLNPEFPTNYLNVIFDLLRNTDKIVLVSSHRLDIMEAISIAKPLLVYPQRDLLGEYIKRWQDRGNSEEFIKTRIAEFNTILDRADSFKNLEKIYLKSGEFLDTALIQYGLELKPKKKIEKDKI